VVEEGINAMTKSDGKSCRLHVLMEFVVGAVKPKVVLGHGRTVVAM
jgi:hypothetical protein